MWLQPYFEQAHGLLRFDRFMELALYDPDHGYYSRNMAGIGRDGDFATSATLSGSLGRAVAAWIREHRPRHVIEVGAGTGQLAAAVRRSLGLRERFSTRYHIVERSPSLRTSQQNLLGRSIRWHHTIEDALAACDGNVSLFSNELVDAFPVRIYQVDRDVPGAITPRDAQTARPHPSFSELHLALDGTSLTESLQPVTSLPDSTVFTLKWPQGQRLEVHECYHHWLAALLPHWKHGELLTIDYGGTPSEIYHRRPNGSLRGYLAHEQQLGPAVYQSPGRLDLTTDVNFNDLEHWGSTLGLETVSQTTQREFLLPHLRPTEADRFLADPAGAGDAFKVLRQRREQPPVTP